MPEAPSPAILASHEVSADRAAWVSALDVVGGATAASPTTGADAGTGLLSELALLPPAQVHDFLAGHPDLLGAFRQAPPPATDVAAWWVGMPVGVRSDLESAAAGLVGNLEGLPYAVRDRANRLYLEQTRSALKAQLDAGVGRAAAQELKARVHMLEQVAAALEVGPSGNPRALVALDPAGTGTAVITVGDVSTADYVNYLIPGMFSPVEAQIVDFANSSDRIATAQQEWLRAFGSDETVAVVGWIGYRTPGIIDATSLDLARVGQTALTASIHGLRAARGADQPYLGILAHSYGSTVAMLALQDDDVAADALAVVGSPGSPAASVAELNVARGNVWVGAAAGDPVPQTGLFGSQPGSDAYGAHGFGVDGAVDPVSGAELRGAYGHNDYFLSGTESFRNMVLIGIDRGSLVIRPDGTTAAKGFGTASPGELL